MTKAPYGDAIFYWKKVGKARRIFQKIIGIDRPIFQKLFWKSDRDLP
jgi:hypothetical protein